MGRTRRFNYIEIILIFIVIIWGVHLLSYILPIRQYGIQPRTASGLIGILASPFLHGSWTHLTANTASLLIFGLLFAFLEKKNTFFILISILLLQGILTWLFARSANHIGASGVIFGLFGYLLLIGIFKKSIKYMAISIIVLLSFGTMIYGVFPSSAQISWEGHLFGFISGGLTARFIR